MQKLAVLLIPGMHVEDRDFAETPSRLLRKHFRRHSSGPLADADSTLVFETVHWAPILERPQRELLDRQLSGRFHRFFDSLSSSVRGLHRGSHAALLPFLGSLMLRKDPRVGRLHYPSLRWLLTHFIGDALAYSSPSASPQVYDAVHGEVALALSRLRQRAGPTAPLCVIAHGLGSVLASNFFYDLQAERSGHGQKVTPSARALLDASPLERGETLTWLYSLGSPLALQALRYPGHALDAPLHVSAPELSRHHPGLEGEWLNFYDEDDVLAWPLRPLGPAYQRAVRRDERVSLRALPFGWLPLVHPFYWSDAAVLTPMARALARGAQQLAATLPGSESRGVA